MNWIVHDFDSKYCLQKWIEMQSFCSNGELINTSISGSVAGLSTDKQYTRVRVPAYAPQTVLLEKRKFKVFFNFYCPLSKKRKLLKYSAELNLN